jgi:hypothetical protein
MNKWQVQNEKYVLKYRTIANTNKNKYHKATFKLYIHPDLQFYILQVFISMLISTTNMERNVIKTVIFLLVNYHFQI